MSVTIPPVTGQQDGLSAISAMNAAPSFPDGASLVSE